MKKLVVLGVTGSIAAVRSFDLCRELCRHGFAVQVIMSAAGNEMITSEAMEFASGRPVITRITGKVEHVKMFGKKGKASLFLVAPATANTISKIAMGIDDTPVTTMATVAIGAGKPVLLAPAMHNPMYEHPVVLENLGKLESSGVRVIAPLEEEGKAKLAGIEEIVFEVEKALSGNKFSGKRMLVVTGAIREKIDDIRAITNSSTGELGTALALALLKDKAEVKVIGNMVGAGFLGHENADFAGELEEKALGELEKGYDYFFCPAAIPDFTTKKTEGKISSSKAIALRLEPREKLVVVVRRKFPQVKIVAFKAVWGVGRKGIEKAANGFLRVGGLHAVAATDLKTYNNAAAEREMFFCSAKRKKWLKGTKQEIAEAIVSML